MSLSDTPACQSPYLLIGFTHQVFVDALRSLAARGDALHYQRCAGRSVAGSKHLVDRALLAGIGFDIASLVLFDAELFEQSLCHRVCEAHSEQHELGGDNLFFARMDEIHATGLRVFIPAYLLYFHFVDMSVLADELACIKKPAARISLLMTAGSILHPREIWPRSLLSLIHF